MEKTLLGLIAFSAEDITPTARARLSRKAFHHILGNQMISIDQHINQVRSEIDFSDSDGVLHLIKEKMTRFDLKFFKDGTQLDSWSLLRMSFTASSSVCACGVNSLKEIR